MDSGIQIVIQLHIEMYESICDAYTFMVSVQDTCAQQMYRVEFTVKVSQRAVVRYTA